MNAVLLCIILTGCAVQSITVKSYNKKSSGRGLYIWVAMMTLSAALFFTIAAKGKLVFEPALLPHSLGFAIFYAMATACNAEALKYGPLSLTTLVISYSLIIPTLYGMLFLNETPGILSLVGLALLIVSIFLINYKKGEHNFSKKWVVLAFLAFFGNGVCSTLQKLQQLTFDGAYKSEFMIFAMLMIALVAGVAALASRRKESVECIKNGWLMALLYGLANGCINMLVMVLGGRMPVSIMFPLISAGQILLAGVLSRFVYKERLSRQQLVGMIIGVLSIIMFNV